MSEAANKVGPPHADGNALHVPMLLEKCMNLLGPALTAGASMMIGATLGMGEHSFAFLERFANLIVVGIDRDPEAIGLAGERLACFGRYLVAIRATCSDMSDVAAEYGRAGRVDVVLMNLGVSSLQLDDKDCGSSYSGDDLLDMRMGKTGGLTTVDILAPTDKVELTWILREYGEKGFALHIAARILAARAAGPIGRTGQLANIIRDAIPTPTRHTGGSPCKRTFQALRIAVNDEFAPLWRAIPCAIETIAVGSRIAVESYQSLGGKIVKREMAKGATSSIPTDLPVELDDRIPYLRLLTRGVVKADIAELQASPRSASVRLRAAERLYEIPHTT